MPIRGLELGVEAEADVNGVANVAIAHFTIGKGIDLDVRRDLVAKPETKLTPCCIADGDGRKCANPRNRADNTGSAVEAEGHASISRSIDLVGEIMRPLAPYFGDCQAGGAR